MNFYCRCHHELSNFDTMKRTMMVCSREVENLESKPRWCVVCSKDSKHEDKITFHEVMISCDVQYRISIS